MLMSEPVKHDTLLRELRRFNLYPPEERQLFDLRSKVESRFLVPDRIFNPQQTARFAVLLYGLALKSLEAETSSTVSSPSAYKTEDSAVDICLDALSNLDLFGRTLAAEILSCKLMPLSKVKEWFNRQTETSHIAVADRMLALSHDLPQERKKLAQAIISKVSDFDPEEAVTFFKKNGTHKGQLTFFTLEKFMSGNYGSKCRKELTQPESLEQISFYSGTVPSYPDNELVTDVALHLRTMDPLIMEKVLCAINRLAESIDNNLLKEIMPLAESPTLSLGKAAMNIIAKFGCRKSGPIFAQLFNNAPKIRAEIINRLPRLDSDNFAKFMTGISPHFHAPVISALFSTLCEEDPHCFGQNVSAMMKGSRGKNNKALSAIIAEAIRIDTPKDPAKPASPVGRPVPGVDFVKLGAPIVLNIEKKQAAKGFKRIFGKEIEESDASPDIYVDAQISNQRLHKLNRWKSLSKNLTFQSSTFNASDLRASTMEKCKFVGCNFESTSFADAILIECEFKNCSFSGCSFNNSMLYDTTFKKCSIKTTHFDSATFFLCSINQNDFSAVTIAGAFLCRTQIKSCTFDISDFRETVFFRGVVNGVTIKDSDFEKTFFNNTEIKNISLSNCSTGKCQAVNILTDAPAMLTAMERTLGARLAERERLKKKPAGLSKLEESARDLIFKAIKRWFAVKDINRNYEKFAENNERRTSWAEEKLTDKAKIFFKILPVLLHTDIFEKALKLEAESVPSKISGYTPSPETTSILTDLFPEIKPEENPENFVPIETILTIGSIGTIAQTVSSDLDCWVCCDFSLNSSVSRDRLKYKLGLIEEWAMREFSVEVHFFLMDVQEVRDNNFGISDAESSGSAQGAILKEEFYRSALLIAGKPPLWWFSPVEATDKIYQTVKKRVAVLKGQNFAVDLGNVPRIPGEEFFGASLWQIVKGVKSPFKSIMKFGLLERYTSGTRAPLLCETIKKNILEGQRELIRVDPYMLMYRELAVFYNRQGEFENGWLTGMALRLKCGLLGEKYTNKTPERPEEKDLIEFTENISRQSIDSDKQDFVDLTDFKSVLTLGEKINLFMINTYQKIRKEQNRFAGVSITPEDLTKLGRKIAANYTQRQFKINRLCLPGPKTHFFKSILASRPNPKKWVLNGEYPDESGARNIFTEIKSSPKLPSILAWLVLNGLYDSSIKIKTDLSSSPVRDRDIRKLFTDIKKFFPPKSIFDTPIEETLNPERMLKAFFIVNLSIPRETNAVKEVCLLYNTNWGEVFCKPLKINRKLVESPAAYLLSEMKDICSTQPEMQQYVPQNSACPFLKIPVGSKRAVIKPEDYVKTN
ncbi:adenylate cyclase, class 1 [Maridesulfovibrio ferrireducens]|uniref:Adenylate cyclase, class 1 n=1 Tax=Maridesulfovibrio ferrireducens TaxID=246191 RepID=A0A1G9AVF9_9BACT|nr:class I adenylate cyclase [Maridesulfovibrio ferrireducens]SDK31193.1 adenylate cyclase, class 1 [Maridesulfovibrio ferrireducens]